MFRGSRHNCCMAAFDRIWPCDDNMIDKLATSLHVPLKRFEESKEYGRPRGPREAR
jgi:hypothetical protein